MSCLINGAISIEANEKGEVFDRTAFSKISENNNDNVANIKQNRGNEEGFCHQDALTHTLGLGQRRRGRML